MDTFSHAQLEIGGVESGCTLLFFFFQAEDGIRDAQESRGLGDVYKRQDYTYPDALLEPTAAAFLALLLG